jgi:alpha-1,2-mannosyltransferase
VYDADVKKIFALIIFSLSVAQVSFGIGKILSRTELIDYKVYYEASQHSLQGKNPYWETYGANITYNYPPSALLLFWPFSFLPLSSSQWVFTVCSAAFLIISVILLTDKLHPFDQITLRLLLIALFFQNFPTKFTLVMGQVNLFILFFLTVSFVADQRKKEITSGIFYGLAAMVKLTPLALGLYFLVRKKYKTLLAGILVFSFANFVVLFYLGGTTDFFTVILPQLLMQTGTQSSLYDQSLRAFVAHLGTGELHIGISACIVFLLYGSAIYKYVQSLPTSFIKDLLFFSLILAITTIGNSYTWHHHLVFLFPGFVAQAYECLKKRSVMRTGLLFISALLVGMHFSDIAHPPTAHPFLISHALWGTNILIGLLLTSLLWNKRTK